MSQGLPQPDVPPHLPFRVELPCQLRHQHNDGGAELEVTHFFPLQEAQWRRFKAAASIVPLPDLSRPRWRHDAMPDRGDAADDGGADRRKSVV